MPEGAELNITEDSTGSLTATGSGSGSIGSTGIGGGKGGSVKVSSMGCNVYDGYFSNAYLVTINVPNIADITNVTYTVDGGSSVSSFTDASGKLYLWLPVTGAGSETEIIIDIDGDYYKASGSVIAANTNNFSAASYTLLLSISTDSLPDGSIEEDYSITMTAACGSGSYSWSATGLPSGLSINPSTGAISGKPTDTGKFDITVTVTDSNVDTASNINSIGITAETADPTAILTISGADAQSTVVESVYLDQGANLIPIVVTSPDGNSQKSYIISVNGKVSNADLDSLAVDGYALNETFAVGLTDYTLAVGSGVDSLELSAGTDDPKAMMLVNGAILSSGDTKTIGLIEGENKIEVMVVAQDASTKTYTITVDKE